MVSSGVCRPHQRHAAGTAAGAAALIVLAACGGGDGSGTTPADTSAAASAAERVRAGYTAHDLVVTGAWTTPAADGGTFVLADVQSTLAGIVQARLDLWYATDTSTMQVGRSDVLSAAAEVGAFAFQDLTGDGLPDLLGYVADSSDTRYPVFIAGAIGQMSEELETSAPGWRFDVAGDSLASARVASPGRACYLRLWALDPAPDGRGEGWRYISVLPRGRLGAPSATLPSCGPG